MLFNGLEPTTKNRIYYREEIFYKEQLYLNQDEENMIVDQEAKIKTLN